MNRNIFFTAELQRSFDTDGIICIPLLSDFETNSLQKLYQTTSNGISDREFHSTMFVDDTDYRRKTNEAIKKIILQKVNAVVSNYRMLFANFIVKAASVNTEVGIHQDWNFTSPEYTSINLWVPLVDINEQTGLFHALKGSHRTFKNIRYTPLGVNTYAGLENFIHENSSAFTVKAGEALIYHGALVHYSDANFSDSVRIAVGGVMIPVGIPNLHYYKRAKDKNELEVYEVNEDFYNRFDFFNEPKGVKKVSEIKPQYSLPSISELIQFKNG